MIKNNLILLTFLQFSIITFAQNRGGRMIGNGSSSSVDGFIPSIILLVFIYLGLRIWHWISGGNKPQEENINKQEPVEIKENKIKEIKGTLSELEQDDIISNMMNWKAGTLSQAQSMELDKDTLNEVTTLLTCDLLEVKSKVRYSSFDPSIELKKSFRSRIEKKVGRNKLKQTNSLFDIFPKPENGNVKRLVGSSYGLREDIKYEYEFFSKESFETGIIHKKIVAKLHLGGVMFIDHCVYRDLKYVGIEKNFEGGVNIHLIGNQGENERDLSFKFVNNVPTALVINKNQEHQISYFRK